MSFPTKRFVERFRPYAYAAIMGATWTVCVFRDQIYLCLNDDVLTMSQTTLTAFANVRLTSIFSNVGTSSFATAKYFSNCGNENHM